MGRALSYKPNAEIKSKQTFTGSTTLPQNSNLNITISQVNRNKSKLFGSNNGYGGNVIYYRMFYFTSDTEVRGITRNSSGSGANGYIRYSVDVVEYY